jgi:hypothetical protein
MLKINRIFPGFTTGDFALLYGSHAISSLASLLCVRAQFPLQLGGLGSNTVFIDGGNTFRLYQITRLARLYQLDAKKVLDRIYISRAFTAYQMTSLILRKLKDAYKTCKARLVIVSDIAAMFLDKNMQDKEAKSIYRHVTTHLSNFAREHQVIIVATYPPHIDSRRNAYLQALTRAKANVVIALKQTKNAQEVILEKHPTFPQDSLELPSETLPLTIFMEA